MPFFDHFDLFCCHHRPTSDFQKLTLDDGINQALDTNAGRCQWMMIRDLFS